MMKKAVSIIGSTGSIGVQALDVIRQSYNLSVVGLTTNTNIELLEKQIIEFKPAAVAVSNDEAAEQFEKRAEELGVKMYTGIAGICETASLGEADITLVSVVGSVGIKPTIAAIEAGKTVALANKESLVSAGELIMNKARIHKVNILPVDSEHAAIFQCIQNARLSDVNKIYLTCSGGPFRGYLPEMLRNVTPASALQHPSWNMGKKISVDSATLMNKGLEVIEACRLFDVSPDQVEVLVHPQSVIHSMVEFKNGSVMAQLSEPDMRLPISYMLNYPDCVENNFPKVDFLKRNRLTFEPPFHNNFPCLNLAYEALKIGGTMPAVLNSANEAAVTLFLYEKIRFTDIPALIEKAMSSYTAIPEYTYNDLVVAEVWAKEFVLNHI